jgi:hypothetical protein
MRPNPSLKPFAGLGFVSEDRVLQLRHRVVSLTPSYL